MQKWELAVNVLGNRPLEARKESTYIVHKTPNDLVQNYCNCLILYNKLQ